MPERIIVVQNSSAFRDRVGEADYTVAIQGPVARDVPSDVFSSSKFVFRGRCQLQISRTAVLG